MKLTTTTKKIKKIREPNLIKPDDKNCLGYRLRKILKPSEKKMAKYRGKWFL